MKIPVQKRFDLVRRRLGFEGRNQELAPVVEGRFVGDEDIKSFLGQRVVRPEPELFAENMKELKDVRKRAVFLDKVVPADRTFEIRVVQMSYVFVRQPQFGLFGRRRGFLSQRRQA